jgi:hypothetical protein
MAVENDVNTCIFLMCVYRFIHTRVVMNWCTYVNLLSDVFKEDIKQKKLHVPTYMRMVRYIRNGRNFTRHLAKRV